MLSLPVKGLGGHHKEPAWPTARFGLPDRDLVRDTLMFAFDAHESIGQTRKYTSEPYFLHPVRVAVTLHEYGFADHVIAASLLHDVVEDTPVTLSELRSRFGDDVADLVHWVTNPATLSDGNRKVRAAINRRHVTSGPAEAQTIKAADILDNVPSIILHDPSFASVYVPEKLATLDLLTKAEPAIRARARDACNSYGTLNREGNSPWPR